MNTEFSVKDAVTRRYSVRTYEKTSLEPQLVRKLVDYANSLENPFGVKIRVQTVEKETAANGEKLGTYGVIKGAKLYLGVTVPDKPHAMEAVGYDFEKLVLYAASLGLGTCWLGGTFNRSAFAEAMEIKEAELFPILSPLGLPSDKKSLTEKLMRKTVKADQRLPWQQLFFTEGFEKPLTDGDGGSYAFPLEMVRLAPSAVNKQPWRISVEEGAVHFYRKGIPAEGSIDMQRIDLGIALCHFDLAARESGLAGHIEISPPDIAMPEGLEYIASWRRD